MKKTRYIICLLLCVLAFASACFAKKQKYSPTSVIHVASDASTITMRAIGVGETRQEALDDAEMKVFDVILFRGVPESGQKMALVSSNESMEMMKNNPYFTEFYNGRRYKSFIVNSSPVGDFTKLKGRQFQTNANVKVNFVNLRRDLEQNGIIRKFGF